MTDASGEQRQDIIGELLRLGTGFTESERQEIVERLTPLEKRLLPHHGHGGAVELRLSVKDRGTPQQRVTLECLLPSREALVAGSDEQDLTAALAEVRDGLIHELDKLNTKRDPRRDRPHRP